MSLDQYTITIPKGVLLFHGTAEGFSEEELRPGRYDQVLWTARTPDIAQNYIPESGTSIYIGVHALGHPSQDKTVQLIQKRLGIEWDLSKVEFDYRGVAVSFPKPIGMDTWLESEDVQKRMEQLGFEEGDYHTTYEVKIDSGKMLLPNEKMMGRLFILEVKEPLKIFDMTLGGEVESDIGNVQYHSTDIFEKAKNKGFDGVKINDFAQSKIWGNLGHLSIGLFESVTSKLNIKFIPASNYDWETDEDFEATTTPEYEAYIN
jgi:hypothetical protein